MSWNPYKKYGVLSDEDILEHREELIPQIAKYTTGYVQLGACPLSKDLMGRLGISEHPYLDDTYIELEDLEYPIRDIQHIKEQMANAVLEALREQEEIE